MLIPATDADFAALVAGTPVRALTMAPGGVESPEIITMLHTLSTRIAPAFAPNAWIIVENGEIAGLCSITVEPQDGVLTIGYGVAASRRQRGVARRAIADLIKWATTDSRVAAITAATAPDNPASQRALAANGFVQTGTTIDPDDGPLVLWRLDLDRPLAAKPTDR